MKLASSTWHARSSTSESNRLSVCWHLWRKPISAQLRWGSLQHAAPTLGGKPVRALPRSRKHSPASTTNKICFGLQSIVCWVSSFQVCPWISFFLPSLQPVFVRSLGAVVVIVWHQLCNANELQENRTAVCAWCNPCKISISLVFSGRPRFLITLTLWKQQQFLQQRQLNSILAKTSWPRVTEFSKSLQLLKLQHN